MPRGKYVNHKGRSRHFTSPEELEQESDESSSGAESSSDEEQPRGSGAKPKCAAPAGKMPTSSEESDEDSDDRGAKKGVAGLIEIENPNRAVKKASQKMAKVYLEDDGSPPKPELSRREREQIEKQKARQRYEKLHAEGKTAQAKADLARLALIRKQRADSAAKREAELKKKTTCEKKPDEMTKSGKVQQD